MHMPTVFDLVKVKHETLPRLVGGLEPPPIKPATAACVDIPH